MESIAVFLSTCVLAVVIFVFLWAILLVSTRSYHQASKVLDMMAKREAILFARLRFQDGDLQKIPPTEVASGRGKVTQVSDEDEAALEALREVEEEIG